MDELLGNVPAYFESYRIHIAGLVVASYAGEEYSHYLAESSLGTWLKEEGIPAMYGVDTRALTKRIREKGSMLGRMLLQTSSLSNGATANGVNGAVRPSTPKDWRPYYDKIDWVNPNKQNLVAEGKSTFKQTRRQGRCS